SCAFSAACRTPVVLHASVVLNLSLLLRLAPGASLFPYTSLFRSSPALAPVMAMPLIVRVVVPTFVNVTVLVPLVAPIATVPKFKLACDSATTVPLVRLQVAEIGRAAWRLRLRTAVGVPDGVGLNVTLIAQLAPAASELPQV